MIRRNKNVLIIGGGREERGGGRKEKRDGRKERGGGRKEKGESCWEKGEEQGSEKGNKGEEKGEKGWEKGEKGWEKGERTPWPHPRPPGMRVQDISPPPRTSPPTIKIGMKGQKPPASKIYQ